MNPTTEDIKDMLLGDSSLSITGLGVDLFIAREPTTPDNVITLYDTSTRPPLLTIPHDGNYYYESIQVRVRNTSYLTGYTLIDSIRTFLHGRAGETWNGMYYSLIRCVSGPFMLQWDENDRVIFIMNFEVQRR